MRNNFKKYSGERCLIFDESGNLGSSGRYFVIACIDTNNYKALHNVMKRKLGKAKKKFSELGSLHSHEIKAKEAYPCIKFHISEIISSKELSISYIVADLKHVKKSLLKDKNILYNYLTKLLIERLVTKEDNGTKLNIICDNHTTKVGSVNSFKEYIKIFLLFEKEYDIELNIEYIDSDDRNAYPVQAADYVANILYGLYEYNDDVYSKILKGTINHSLEFPPKLFGK
jgi:hypothetical protein